MTHINYPNTPLPFQPLVSIIIAVKNAKAHLEQTLANLCQQTYPHLQVIVIDGGSQDGTQQMIETYHDKVHVFVSEPDLGISDAFNKGLKHAQGDYINFQGAGDILISPDCIMQLFSGLDISDKLICGQVIRVKEDGITPLWIAPKKAKPFKKQTLLFKMPLPHQALFTHRSFFEKFGHFDKNVKFAMDYELLLRAYHHFPKTTLKRIPISYWRAGGIGQNRIPEILNEYHRIKIQHQVASKWMLQCIHQWSRIKYYVKQWLKMAY